MRCQSRAWSQKSLYSHTLLILSSSDKGFLFFPQACKKRVGIHLQGTCLLQQPQLTPQFPLPPESQLFGNQEGCSASEWKGERERERRHERRKKTRTNKQKAKYHAAVSRLWKHTELLNTYSDFLNTSVCSDQSSAFW